MKTFKEFFQLDEKISWNGTPEKEESSKRELKLLMSHLF